MHRRLPTFAILLGIAGLIPFFVAGFETLGSGDVAVENYWAAALIFYAAVILAFLGAVHWGFVLAVPAPELAEIRAARERYRLIMGVIPALVAWVALMLFVASLINVSLAVLIGGFIVFTSAESELRRRDLVPSGYMWLRWALTIIVVITLGTVFALRLVGGRLIL